MPKLMNSCLSSRGLGRASCAALTAAIALATTSAHAGGLYFTDRGVRPLGRGGAFIAGADDAGSVAYNPAGLAFTGHQFLLDASWLQYSATYQRKTIVRQIDPNTQEPTGVEWEQTYPQVEGTTPVLPIPTIVYADPLGSDKYNFAIGVWAPYAAITSFPETVKGQPAPQRYSIISLDGSALAIPGVYASMFASDDLALGAGIEMLTGFFQTSVYFSACVPERFLCAPEQPEYDTYAQLRVGPIFAPSGIVGAIYEPSEVVRVGASFHLPFWVHSHATQDVRLASAAVFDNASVKGDSATVDFRLPWTARAGIEFRPGDLRVEAGVGYEAWSMHDEIRVESDEIALVNVAGFPTEYQISPVSIDRGFQDSYSGRLGVEYGFEAGSYRMVTRGGLMAERSAIPTEYLSAATIDLDKVVASIGGSLHIGKWRFDGVFARVFTSSVEVGAREQRVRQVNPVLSNPPRYPNYINGGTYTASANVIGLGLAYQFDSTEEPPTRPSAAPPAEPREPEVQPKPESEPKAEPKPEPKAKDDDGGFDEAFDKADDKPKPKKK
ncbi:MAG: outer membrane protein transport protein [Polyangiaceae bacterium]